MRLRDLSDRQMQREAAIVTSKTAPKHVHEDVVIAVPDNPEVLRAIEQAKERGTFSTLF
jgi:hypothetical protein